MYSSKINTENPFLEGLLESWRDLVKPFQGQTVIEIIVDRFTQLIIMIFFGIAIPLGFLISLNYSFYNVQKDAYDRIIRARDSHEKITHTIAFGITWIPSFLFLFVAIPAWILGKLILWICECLP